MGRSFLWVRGVEFSYFLDHWLLGCGRFVKVFKLFELISEIAVFEHGRVHGLDICESGWSHAFSFYHTNMPMCPDFFAMLCFGGRSLTVLRTFGAPFSVEQVLNQDFPDWVMSARLLGIPCSAEIDFAVGFGHNSIEFWRWRSETDVERVSRCQCVDSPLLYCMDIRWNSGTATIEIVSGSVFGKVIRIILCRVFSSTHRFFSLNFDLSFPLLFLHTFFPSLCFTSINFEFFNFFARHFSN